MGMSSILALILYLLLAAQLQLRLGFPEVEGGKLVCGNTS